MQYGGALLGIEHGRNGVTGGAFYPVPGPGAAAGCPAPPAAGAAAPARARAPAWVPGPRRP